jgi:hypothetical protein
MSAFDFDLKKFIDELLAVLDKSRLPGEETESP